ncbi:hypothetical protein [Pseudoalteromonas peptidolytica]|uniref:hypothetical protein n=1 Tax=Pseudoalteromonas peptidolytica TaxID=61150 RepID=UPI00298E13BC|nr:hypothetical protein [Pseudoalteromonas peptidolytica]MDW7547993.1 hypothetical protein [Pseudoalteromonas peptidolytica]
MTVKFKRYIHTRFRLYKSKLSNKAVIKKKREVCKTVLYYDQDPVARRAFLKRHRNNPRIRVIGAKSISETLSYIDLHILGKIRIDLINNDFYGEKRVLNEHIREYQRFKAPGDGDKVEYSQLIADFLSHKDHINLELSKRYTSEGLNAVYTLLDYLDFYEVSDIQVGIYSMLGRRLISSKDASRLQSKGVLWIWKSKEVLLQEEGDYADDVLSDADKNAEFDSIHTAIMTGVVRDKKLAPIFSCINRTILISCVQAITLCLVLGLVGFQWWSDNIVGKPWDVGLLKSAFNKDNILNSTAYLLSIFIIFCALFDARFMRKKMKKLMK